MSGILIRQLAIRYLLGKNSANAVPVLSRISMVAIAVGSGALIVLFSVFNGFESLVKESYKAFYPEIKITPVKGKFFSLTDDQLNNIKHLTGVNNITQVIEDNVLIRDDNAASNSKNSNNQLVLTLKGIESNYFKVNDIKQYLLRGADSVHEGEPNTAIVGEHIIKELGIDYNNLFSYIIAYYINPNTVNPELDPESAFQSLRLHPAGAFSVLEEFDSKFILAPLSLVQKLFNAEAKYSSLEIDADKNMVKELKPKLQSIIGNNFNVESRYEQNKTMYMVMNTEKWAVYLILLLVLFIASFNLVGALSMLALEKQKDIGILKAMGMRNNSVRLLIIMEGVLWSLIGGVAGLIIGCSICFAQQEFGIIKMKGAFIVSAYPVKMQFTDVLIVLATIIVIGIFASLLPSYKAVNAINNSLNSRD